ncbi:hypothetical protein DWUX_2150 [Desulfovibrio diazotrophicus]|nr:hypothetical protein DWUX_2150 [Desulfovibrio diazotrophicus]
MQKQTCAGPVPPCCGFYAEQTGGLQRPLYRAAGGWACGATRGRTEND